MVCKASEEAGENDYATMLSSLLALGGLRKKWPQLSEEEVRRHNTRNSLWIISGNSVYDVTDILYSHPGGDIALLRRGGGSHDCTKDYDFHSRYARRQWAARKLGEVVASDDGDSEAYFSCSSSGSWGEEEEEEEESKAGRAQQQQRQQTAVREKACYTVTVKVGGSEVGVATQDTLECGGVCMCPRCGRLAE